MSNPAEYKLLRLRELESMPSPGDQPGKVVAFWHANIPAASWYDDHKECSVVIHLNVRKVVIGFHLVSIGTLDSTLVHPRDVFAPALVAGAHSIVLMHNHPSGDPSPSEDDIRLTRELIRGGRLLKVELLDSIIVGNCSGGSKGWASLRELGFFYV